MQTLTINGQDYQIKAPEGMPLLWAIRDLIGLTGTKFGCGVAQCGACSIMIDGVVVRSCSTMVSQGIGKKITTIEGSSDSLTAVTTSLEKQQCTTMWILSIWSVDFCS